MTRGELCDWLVARLKDYKSGGILESVKRNSHMNEYKNEKVSQETVDAILVDFVNFLAGSQCIDLALYTKDLKNEE